MPRKVDVFSTNHAFTLLAAYTCHLAGCPHATIVEHPYTHSIPILADGTTVKFKRGKANCSASMTKVDPAVGLNFEPFVLRKLEIVIPDFAAFEKEAHAFWEAHSKGKIQVFYSSYSQWHQAWERAALLPRRDLNTIYADPATMKTMRDTLGKFLASEAEYVKAGRPYKLVSMLHGPPGTGKTSLIFGLLSEFKFDKAYVMSFGATMTDSNFLGLVHTMDPASRNALILEDADTLVVNRKDKQGMSFTTMLNVLDGYLRPHGLVCFMTTNKIQAFDEAMTRAGRMDLLIEVGQLDRDGAREFAARSLPKRVPLARRNRIAESIVRATTNPSAISAFAFQHRADSPEEIESAAAKIPRSKAKGLNAR